jgi:SAM-dependent methyltransferase
LPERRVGVHRMAAVGFERTADTYERGRPGYPDAAVHHLVATLGIGSGRSVVELGPGTGKLSADLVATGARVIGVEPVAAMRRVLSTTLPGIDVVGGVAEQLPIADAAADAAVAAQVFHWLDGDLALAQLARVLRPGGGIGLMWNVRDETASWVRALAELTEPYRDDTPTHRSDAWRAAFERSDEFGGLERRSFPYAHPTNPSAVADRIESISFIAARSDATRDSIREQVHAVLSHDPATRGRARFTFPYRTDVWASFLRAPAAGAHASATRA